MQRVLFVIAMTIGWWVFFPLSNQEVLAAANNGWFITYTGDVHGESGIMNDRPTSAVCNVASPAFMSLINGAASPAWDAGVMSGIVSYGVDFDGGCVADSAVSQAVSTNGQPATVMSNQQRGYTTAANLDDVKNDKLYYGYDYYINHIPADLFNPSLSGNSLSNGDIDDGIYFKFDQSGDVNVQPLHIGSTDKKVVLVNGSVNINHAISVDPGGFFALIAKGDIIIDSTVTGTADNPGLQGVYIADGTIQTESKTPAVDDTLYAAGIFISWSNIHLQRKLGPSANISTPAEVFIYRPDFLVTAPKEFMDKPYLFTEIKP